MLCLKAHVVSVCFKCFRGMLQLFHMDVAKEDRDDAYVVMVVHICCNSLFLMFYLFFRSMFICMLHMFQTYVTSVISGCCIYFAMPFQVFSGVFASIFRHMLQVL